MNVNKQKIFVNGAQSSTEKSTGQQTLEIMELILDIFILIIKIFYTIGEAIYRLIVPVTEKSVRGEIVLITGTGHGIGKQLALQYAAAGATVVGWDVNEKNNKETIKEINELGYTKAYSYVCDVSNRENVFEIAKRVQNEVGDVTIIVNNAGIMPTHSVLEHTQVEIERIFGINVLAHFWILQAFLPVMLKKNYGHIVALSSCAGLIGFTNLVPYCASKFAVRGLMESLHEELRENYKSDIKVTVIYPYMVDTGLCKKPRIRFKNAMPMLDPKKVAQDIIHAQRTNTLETTLPSYILPLNNYGRTLPHKSAVMLKDFLGSGLESDL